MGGGVAAVENDGEVGEEFREDVEGSFEGEGLCQWIEEERVGGYKEVGRWRVG